jgi:hypothetical protein
VKIRLSSSLTISCLIVLATSAEASNGPKIGGCKSPKLSPSGAPRALSSSRLHVTQLSTTSNVAVRSWTRTPLYEPIQPFSEPTTVPEVNYSLQRRPPMAFGGAPKPPKSSPERSLPTRDVEGAPIPLSPTSVRLDTKRGFLPVDDRFRIPVEGLLLDMDGQIASWRTSPLLTVDDLRASPAPSFSRGPEAGGTAQIPGSKSLPSTWPGRGAPSCVDGKNTHKTSHMNCQ